MNKRSKRFDEGGAVNQEAADKAAGLAASKDEDVGFLGRMRMGNIDDPSSEAYKRFGAGRGAAARAARVPVEDRVPTRVSRPAPQEEAPVRRAAPVNEEAALEMTREARRTTPQAPAKAEVTEDDMARLTAAKKQQVKADSAKEREEVSSRIPGGGPEGWTGGKGEKIDSTELGRNVSNTLAALPGTNIARGAKYLSNAMMYGRGAKAAGHMGERAKEIGNAPKELGYTPQRSNAPYLKEIGMEPTKIGAGVRRLEGAKEATKETSKGETLRLEGPKKAAAKSAKEAPGKTNKKVTKKPRKALDESDTTGGAIGYRRGGSVSSASRRADGIAQRGRTRA